MVFKYPNKATTFFTFPTLIPGTDSYNRQKKELFQNLFGGYKKSILFDSWLDGGSLSWGWEPGGTSSP